MADTEKKNDPKASSSRATPKKKKPVPKDGNRASIDLDAYRQARDEEQASEGPLVTIDGVDYDLPPVLPASVVFALEQSVELKDGELSPGNVLAGTRNALEALFGEAWRAVSEGLSIDEVLFLLGSIVEGYGFTVPESGASST